jgi:cation-transporting P-type ATPase E
MSPVTGEPAPAVESPPHETPASGLIHDEVRDRVARGLTNEATEKTSRTFGEIVRANVLTRFNAILTTMFVIVLAVGSPGDGLFMGVVITNSLIGIVQEVRAKRTLDRLAVLSAPRARVVRDGSVDEIEVDAVVLDDLLELTTGDQVPADGVVRSTAGLEVDESLLTGESDPVVKTPGTEVLSGSFVVAGSGRFQATRVGADAYARKLANEARRFALTRSELMTGIDKILRFVTWALIPISGLLLWSQIDSNGSDYFEALRSTVAAVVGMVPQGLVLLTSVAFGVAAVTLARRNVLVQELPAVEGLARVDVVCLDKTGTLTEGTVQFHELVMLDGDEEIARAALGSLAANESANATMRAIGAAFTPPGGWPSTETVAFSSARKWSAASFDSQGTWVVGAPEMVWAHAPSDDPVLVQADELASTGSRTLLLVHTDQPLGGEELPGGLRAVALVLLEEKLRPDAAETLTYFDAQGVTLKVISGDNPRTVAAVAARVGLPHVGEPFDARELPEARDELADVLEQHSVFGRVTPHQKRAMVAALQSRDHVVAMTGDGVNDALALKDADIGVAMGSGAAATRAVAQLVLLDGKFSTMPGVVAEGRRVIANIERVANLFITKTVYTMLITVVIVLTALGHGWPFPFLPRHLTLIGDFTIGIPAFFLALAPNTQRYVPGFLPRVMRFAIPAGTVAATATLVAYWLARLEGATNKEQKTTATLVLLIVALWILIMLARPLTRWRATLIVVIIAAVVLIVAIPLSRDFFKLQIPDARVIGDAAAVAGVAIAVLELGWQTPRLRQRRGARRVV